MKRIAIVFDGKKWYIRRIRVIELDLALNEKVYRCDKPLANDLDSIASVVAWLAVNRETRKRKWPHSGKGG